MRRFFSSLPVIIALACFAGCGCRWSLEPAPPDADQERRFPEQLEEIEEQERLHLEQEEP